MKIPLIILYTGFVAGVRAGSNSSVDAECDDSITKRSFAITAENLSNYGPPNNGGKEFRLAQVHNQDFRQLDAPSALLRAHAKFGDSLPQSLRKAIEINPGLNKFKSYFKQDGPQTGSIVAFPSPMYDSQYVVPVQIGTPSQTTFLNLDTGSSDLWTFSTDTFPFEVNGQVLYRPGNSETSDLLEGESWSVEYGDGAGAGGIVYTDVVQLGDTSFDHQAVQAAVDVSFEIASDPFASGILGMAMNTANTVRPTSQTTYLENIKDDLALPLFTVDLRAGEPGSYDFGYINKSLFNDAIHFFPVDPESPFWQLPVQGYQIGQNGSFEEFIWDSIVDTGTSLLLAPDEIVDDYYSEVSGAYFDDYFGMMVFPCDEDLPDFIFGFDSYRGVVPGKYINYGPASDTYCYGGMQTSAGIGFSVLGDVLLKAQFVVFDIGAHVLGFANKDIPDT